MQSKKITIKTFNGGMRDSKRHPFSEGASLIKNFDIYTDKQKLIPVAGFTSLIDEEFKARQFKAIGGLSSILYGVGSADTGWYSKKWPYRIAITPNTESSTGDNVYVDTAGSDTNIEMSGYGLDRGGVSWLFTGYINTINKATVRVKKVGSPGDITVSIYTDNAGVPGTLVGTLGTIPAEHVDTFYQDLSVLGSDIILPGTFHIVFRGAGLSADNQYIFRYLSTGTIPFLNETTSNNWASVDTTTTPYLKLAYTDNVNTYNFKETSLPVLLFDLSNMPAQFWSNVNDDGSDIRVISSTGELVNVSLRNFDKDAEEGQLWVKASLSEGQMYLYYGNPDGTVDVLIAETDPFSMDEGTYDSFNWFFHLDGNTQNAKKNTQELENGNPGIYGEGFFGQALIDGVVTGDSDDNLGSLSDNFVVGAFVYKPAGQSSEVVNMIQHTGSNFEIGISSASKLTFSVNGDAATTLTTSTNALTNLQWEFILLHYYDGDHYHYINGELDLFQNTNDGGLDQNVGAIQLNSEMDVNGHVSLDMVFSFNKSADAANFARDWNKMIRHPDQLWTIGSEELLSDHNPTYGGVQIFKGNISDGSWEESISNNQPVKSINYYPTNSFVENSGGLTTLVSGSPELEGFWFQAMQENVDPFNETNTLLTVFAPSNKAQPVTATPVDKKYYYTMGAAIIYELGDPATTAYTAFAPVQSMEPYQNYLAIGSTRRNKGAIELWDLVNDDPVEFIDLGVGYVRVVGVAGDILFGVVNGFIEDEVLSANKPVMEIKRYVGGGRSKTTHRFEIPTNTDANLVEDWEMPISQLKTRFKDFTLFYAKLPTDSTGETFNQGLYAVGKNEMTDELEVSLYVETDALGDIEYIYSIANQIAVIHNRDGSVSKLRDDSVYDLTSRYETLIFDDGDAEKEKKLVGVELYFERLPEGQTVSMFYQIDGGTTWIKLFDHTTTGSTTRECVTVESTDEELPMFKEIEFAIQSTGGAAPITGYGFLIEDTENDVV